MDASGSSIRSAPRRASFPHDFGAGSAAGRSAGRLLGPRGGPPPVRPDDGPRPPAAPFAGGRPRPPLGPPDRASPPDPPERPPDGAPEREPLDRGGPEREPDPEPEPERDELPRPLPAPAPGRPPPVRPAPDEPAPRPRDGPVFDDELGGVMRRARLLATVPRFETSPPVATTASGGPTVLGRRERGDTARVARSAKRPMAPPRWGHLREKSGGVLLSQGVSSQVPSALVGLTSVFGMGTGVTPPLWPPKSCFKGGRTPNLARARTP